MNKFVIVFILIITLFIYKVDCLGSNSFYAQFLLTNREYGIGADFNAKV